MSLVSVVNLILIMGFLILGLMWFYKTAQTATTPFDRARALINGLAEDSRSGRDHPNVVSTGDALEFVKGYVRALDENLIITEAQSLAIRTELKRWPATLIPG